MTIQTFDSVWTSHLRWDVARQRPQRLLRHLSSGCREFGAEVPTMVYDEGELKLVFGGGSRGPRRAAPGVQCVMIGPELQIKEASGPHARSLALWTHAELPGDLRSVNIAIMPIPLNTATLYIGPAKTLGSMAGGMPKVRMPAHDVVELYGEGDYLAASADDYIYACGRPMADGSERTSGMIEPHGWKGRW